LPAVFTAKWLGIPLACSVGTQLQSLNPRRDRILNVLDRLICGTFVFPFCDKVVAWDTQILKYLQDVQGNRVTRKTVIVNYGVAGDPGALLSRPKEYAYRGVVVGVGAVSEQRSFVPLVRAFALLAPEFPDLQLRVVGHVYYDEARRLAKEFGIESRAHFVGELSHDQVIEELSRADAFYSSLTAKYTAMGTATIEAMLLGVPAVVNTPLDLLGTGILEDGVHLVQSSDQDPRAIADKLRSLLTREDRRRAIGQAGREFVATYLNWSKVARDMALVLEKIRGPR
jgi:glycosyltransferase involved in cell wall biosynthesis